MLLRAFAAIFNFVMRGAVFLGIAVLGGFGSAWVMIHSGSQLTAATAGPWVTWISRLFFALPGMSAGPESPPLSSPSR